MRVRAAGVIYRRQHRGVLRPRTLVQHGYIIEGFAAWSGNMAVRAVRARHVAEWAASMEVAASTTRNRISVIRGFFRWCVRMCYTKHDPTIDVAVPRQPRLAPRSMTADDLRTLSAVLPDHRARVIVGFMLICGLRAGEVADLEMADIDLFSNTMRVVGKGGHERVLPIPEGMRYYLDPYLTERGRGGGKLIRSHRDPHLGVTPNYVSCLVSRWMRTAGVKAGRYDGVSAHALRHTTAENLYRHGVDLRTIAAAMGHMSPTTTWTYLRHRANVEDLREVMGQALLDEPRPRLAPVHEYLNPPELTRREDAG